MQFLLRCFGFQSSKHAAQKHTQIKEKSITDSSSWPMLTIWDIEGDADGGTLGMKRDISATDDILIVSSSTREFAENSCIKRQNHAKNLLLSLENRFQSNTQQLSCAWPIVKSLNTSIQTTKGLKQLKIKTTYPIKRL